MMTGLLVAKATAVLAVALLLASHRVAPAAAARHAIVVAAFAVIGLLPLVSRLVPALPVQFAAGSAADVATFSEVHSNAAGSPGLASGAPDAEVDAVTTLNIWRTAWWCGVVIFLCPMLTGSIALRRLRRQSRQARRLTTAARGIAKAAGVRRDIEVRLSAWAHGPLTFGVTRPVIVMPEETEDWRAEDVHRALVHEVEHVVRFDWVTHCVARAVCAIYWFHPLAWIAWRRLCAEAERACDDAVVRSGGGLEYAQQLLALAQRLSRRPRLSLGISARADLRARIASLLSDHPRRTLGRWTAGTIAAVAAAVAVALASARPAASTPVPAAAAGEGGQAAAAAGRLEFDVASVRPNDGVEAVMINRWDLRSGRLTLTNQTLVQLIARAYGTRLASAVRRERIAGGPDWIGRDRFSIVASMPAGVARAEAESSMQTMLRRLLEERFRLKVRIDRRQMPGYSLVALRPGTLGPQVRASVIDCDVAQCGAGGGLAKYDASGIQMFMLARFLEEIVGAPVVDATGLEGTFDGLLEWAPAPEQLQQAGLEPAIASRFSGRPSIFTALQEQWGLRLRSGPVPVEYLVVQSAERPTPD